MLAFKLYNKLLDSFEVIYKLWDLDFQTWTISRKIGDVYFILPCTVYDWIYNCSNDPHHLDTNSEIAYTLNSEQNSLRNVCKLVKIV